MMCSEETGVKVEVVAQELLLQVTLGEEQVMSAVREQRFGGAELERLLNAGGAGAACQAHRPRLTIASADSEMMSTTDRFRMVAWMYSQRDADARTELGRSRRS